MQKNGVCTINHKSIVFLCFACWMVCTFTACAVRTPVRQITSAEMPAQLKYRNILLKDMKLSPSLQANAATSNPIVQCESAAISYLQSKKIFNKVTKQSWGAQEKNTSNAQTMVVETELTYLRIVSSAARIWGGVFAGRSAMKINVVLKDGSDGRVLAQQELVGAPNAYAAAWGSGALDNSLPAKMGYLLGDYIVAGVVEESR